MNPLILFKEVRASTLKRGDVVWSDDGTGRCQIVLHVSEADLKRGINALEEGLHYFSGMWYGTNPYTIKSYGKIGVLKKRRKVFLIGNAKDFTPSGLKKLINGGNLHGS